MGRGLAAFALAIVAAATAPPVAAQAPVAPFSSVAPGSAFPSPWSALLVPGIRPPGLSLVGEEGTTVLRVRAEAAAGTLMHPLAADPAHAPILSWRWKVDRVLDKADLARKEGDDFAARVYVFFDVPEEQLSLAQRARIVIARLLHGARLPTAALCYVWDNRHGAGTRAWNPYTDRVQTVVVESGGARVGTWVAVERDLEADFRAAFGDPPTGIVPRVTGIAAGADTDQTLESVTAWFGDFRLRPRR